MDLDHERLDVYHLALDFLVLASEIIEGLPRGRSHLSDQFSRASLSIVRNLAEGAGKHSKPDKRRYYLTARGSASESAALLDVCCRLKLLEESGHRTGKAMIVRIVSMLIKLAQSCEDARIKSETQPKQRTPDRDHRNVVAESLLVAGSETASLLEQTEGTLDLGARLVQFLVQRELLGSAAIGGDDSVAALVIQTRAK